MTSWGYSLNTHRTPLQREILASAKPTQGHTQGREKRSPRPFGDIGGLLSFLKICMCCTDKHNRQYFSVEQCDSDHSNPAETFLHPDLLFLEGSTLSQLSVKRQLRGVTNYGAVNSQMLSLISYYFSFTLS